MTPFTDTISSSFLRTFTVPPAATVSPENTVFVPSGAMGLRRTVSTLPPGASCDAGVRRSKIASAPAGSPRVKVTVELGTSSV